jgi:hypothetical protein
MIETTSVHTSEARRPRQPDGGPRRRSQPAQHHDKELMRMRMAVITIGLDPEIHLGP